MAIAEKWAKCYRHFSHGDTDTNMYLERCSNTIAEFHNGYLEVMNIRSRGHGR